MRVGADVIVLEGLIVTVLSGLIVGVSLKTWLGMAETVIVIDAVKLTVALGKTEGKVGDGDASGVGISDGIAEAAKEAVRLGVIK